MVYELLAATPFGKEKKGEVGIERLVSEGAYQVQAQSSRHYLHSNCLARNNGRVFFLKSKKYYMTRPLFKNCILKDGNKEPFFNIKVL